MAIIGASLQAEANSASVQPDAKPNLCAVAKAQVKPVNPGRINIPDPNVILQGGDTFATAINIPALPYSDFGTTVGYVDDYDAECPYDNSTSPDVVYKYTPSANTMVNITLCYNSDYDTKLYVHENYYVFGGHIACNDDACSSPSYPAPYVSMVENVSMSAGNTYYITVDGYGSSAGAYTLDIVMCCPPPCPVDCPPGAILEGEPDCGTGYVDHFNGGCGSNLVVFSYVNEGDIICGTSGTFLSNSGLQYRDTDWYQLEVNAAHEMTFKAVGEFPVQLILIDAGSVNCSDCNLITWAMADVCDTASITYQVFPGTWWVWIGPSVFEGYDCPLDYILWMGEASVPCCHVSMIPDTYPITVPPGGSFGLTGTVSNPTDNPIVTDVWVGVKYSGNFYQLHSFPNIALNPGQSINAHLNQYVPGYAPDGIYAYVAYCGDYANLVKCDSASFDFSVSGGRLEGGVSDWILDGGFESAPELPLELALMGNYPNPFNATTTITFILPERMSASVEIFNLLGERVAVLADDLFNAGSHNVTWDASSYSSGVYFCKLSTPKESKALRMVLLK